MDQSTQQSTGENSMWNNRADEPQLISSQSGVSPFPQSSFDNNQGINNNGGGQGGIISNLLRVIGLDGGKIGALAVNGIIFIAQMVRSGIEKISVHFTQSLWDWRTIIHYLVERVQNDGNIGSDVIVPNVVSITT